MPGKFCVSLSCAKDNTDKSTVGFVVGFVGAAAGVTLLLTAPESPNSGIETHAWLGLDSAGVAGSF